MTIDELSIFGYCCTGRVVSAPTDEHDDGLITTANTGCLIKTSVKERMVVPL